MRLACPAALIHSLPPVVLFFVPIAALTGSLLLELLYESAPPLRQVLSVFVLLLDLLGPLLATGLFVRMLV